MLYINEWLPNPVGNDAAGEFIELYNDGSAAVSLGGYTLSDGAKKKFSLSGYSIPPGGYLVLKKEEDKLALKNTDGALLLYGPDGQVVDTANFAGAAPEGKSFSRVDYGSSPIAHFAFEYPTPGAVNKTMDTTVHVNSYPLGASLSSQLSPAEFILLMVSIASFLTLFFFYVTHHNRNISNFFFGGKEKIRS